jgi:hypothetical protein
MTLTVKDSLVFLVKSKRVYRFEYKIRLQESLRVISTTQL